MVYRFAWPAYSRVPASASNHTHPRRALPPPADSALQVLHEAYGQSFSQEFERNVKRFTPLSSAGTSTHFGSKGKYTGTGKIESISPPGHVPKEGTFLTRVEGSRKQTSRSTPNGGGEEKLGRVAAFPGRPTWAVFYDHFVWVNWVVFFVRDF